MSTATAPTTSLDSVEREWLQQMGLALGLKVASGAIPVPPATGASGASPAPPKNEASASSASPSVAGKPILKQGSKGQDVKDLQTLLNKHGSTLNVDGDFGKLTTAAVKEFQTKNPPLKVDGIVGQQTWTALAASKPEPPKPPDTKPRTAIVLVTDGSTNDAVNDAIVKIAETTEKTGNTGQATFSLPPGSYPFGVTADGFEQAIGTFVVTDKDESQLRVELKGGERSTKVVLTVTPAGKSKKGDKLKLTATVTVGAGKTPPPGRIEFAVSLNKIRKQPLATVPLQNGEATHTETLLPAGFCELDATYTPTPAIDGIVQTKSGLVQHEVTQSEKGDDKEVAKRIVDKLNEDDAEGIEEEVQNLQFRQMRRLLNVIALLEKEDKSEKLLDRLRGDKPENDRITVAIFTIQRKFTRREWFTLYSKLSELDRKAVLARTPAKVISAYELENDPIDPPDPDAEPEDPNAKIIIEPAINTKAKLEFHSPLGNFGATEFEVKIGPNGKMKSVEIDMTLVKEKLKKASGLGPVLDLEGKLSLNAEAEFEKNDRRVVVEHVQAAVKAEIQVKFPEIKVIKNVAFTLSAKFADSGEFKLEAAVLIPIPGT